MTQSETMASTGGTGTTRILEHEGLEIDGGSTAGGRGDGVTWRRRSRTPRGGDAPGGGWGREGEEAEIIRRQQQKSQG